MSEVPLPRIEAVLATVASCLTEMFPKDFFKRCAYAASATASLLHDEGAEANVVGGDFAAFILAASGDRAGMQGFGFGQDQCSHFWVEAGYRQIDLGPYFLPFDSSYPVVPMPAVAWDARQSLPRSLRYRKLSMFAATASFSPDPNIQERSARFLNLCRERIASGVNRKFPTWIVTGAPSLDIAANKGNPWAIGAKRFEKAAHLNTQGPL